MNLQVSLDETALGNLCRRYGVNELALFGSVLRDDFTPESDVDAVVELGRNAPVKSLFDWLQLRADLTDLFGRQVDLADKNKLKPALADEILQTRKVIFVARHNDAVYFRHIQEAARDIVAFIGEMDEEAFRADKKTQSAVVYKLAGIGEACSLVGAEAKLDHPAVPWRLAKGLRNVLIHGYDTVDPEKVWDTVQNDLPVLVQQIAGLTEPIAGETAPPRRGGN